MAAGTNTRFLVAVLVTADPYDCGLLAPVVAETEKTLLQAGVEDVAGLQIAADAGDCAQADLAFAERVRDRIDLLIDGAREAKKPNIESVMACRRASSRREGTVVAEVLLKVLAHNISRLLVVKRLSRLYWLITPEGVLVAPGNEFPADL